MKKLLLLSASLFLFAGINAAAQSSFGKGDIALNLGIGLGNDLYPGSYMSKFPPIALTGEYGIVDELFNNGQGVIGVGVYLGYTGAKQDYGLGRTANFNSIVVGVRGALHYEFVQKLDTYAGLMLGYNIANAKLKGDWGTALQPSAASTFSWSLYIGARYWFTEAVGAHLELGYGIAYATLGVSFKF